MRDSLEGAGGRPLILWRESWRDEQKLLWNGEGATSLGKIRRRPQLIAFQSPVQ